MNSSVYDDDTSSYVSTETTFQKLNTYNQYGTVPSPAGVNSYIFPVYGGVGNNILLHNYSREELNGCDYFSLDKAYKTVNTPCTKKK